MSAVFAAHVVTLLLTLGPAAAGDEADGKQVFLTKKCNVCHAVPSAGIEAALPLDPERKIVPLEGTGRDAAWVMKYLKREEKIGEQKHPTKFRGPDPELEALVKWLSTLKPLKRGG